MEEIAIGIETISLLVTIQELQNICFPWAFNITVFTFVCYAEELEGGGK